MATKKTTYKEPSDYFSPAMKKAVREYDRKQAQAQKASKPAPKKK